MTRVLRYDIGSLRKPERTSFGMRAEGYLTTVGVFRYRRADGSEVRELRLPEEVFDAEALASFALAPLTNNHPPVMLDASNAKQYAVGAVGEQVRRDGDMMRASLAVYDAAAIAEMEAGKTQLSCGYSAEMDATPGEHPVFGKYDAVQRSIRGNHVALVDIGRAGPGAHVRMDAGDAEMVGPATKEALPAPEETPMVKVRIDGVEYEVSEQTAQALEKERAAAKAREDALAKERDEAKGKADKAEAHAEEMTAKAAEADKARKDAEDPARVQARVAARVALEVEARRHLGADAKLDGLTDEAVKVEVIKKLRPEAKLDGRSPEYIQARYDAAIESAPDALDRARVDAASSTPPVDFEAIKAKALAERYGAWKTAK